jgi:glycogen synthase
VEYYIIDADKWSWRSVDIVNMLEPDIIHNFANPELIHYLYKKPAKCIYTFDDVNYLTDKIQSLCNYDYITTFSVAYTNILLNSKTTIAQFLKSLPFVGVNIGICDEIFTPKEGLLLSAPYNENNLLGKDFCKLHLCQKYKIPTNKPIFLVMSRLADVKGIDAVISAIPIINDLGGAIIVIGKGEEYYEKELQSLADKKQIFFVNKKFSPFQLPPLISGADFLLQPSKMESGGLMPLIACQYGTIPIVTLNGGFADNMNKENAIIINDTIDSAIAEAVSLFNNQAAFVQKRESCMTQDFSWSIRKHDFIKLYEN